MELTKTQSNARLVTLFGFVAMVLIWGSFPVAVKIGVRDVPPLLLASTRFCLAFCIMAAITLLQRKKLRLTARQHLQLGLLSLLMVAIPSCMFFAAAPYAPAGMLTLVWATSPIFTAIFNVRGTGEANGWRLIGSLAVGSIGILIVLLGRLPFLPGSNGGALSFASNGPALLGELAVLGSAAVYGFGTRMAKRSEISVTALTAWQMFYSGLFMAVVGFLFESNYPFHPTWTTLGALLYLVVFCSCISFFLTFWLIRHIGAIRTAYSSFITPGVTLILSYSLLSESLTLAKVGGLLLIILGVVLVQM